MMIAGMQKLSLIDYPEKLAAVVFTQGCNFRCGFCHNPELVLPPLTPAYKAGEQKGTWEKIGKIANFFAFLESRRGFLEGVCITGGEPLLQEDIEEFIRNIKERGLFVKLDTNGFLADRLERVINKNLVDYIAMDIKTAIVGDEYSRIAGVNVDIEKIKRSIKLIMDSGVDYEFRTTVVADLHKKEDILNIAKYVRGAKKYALQKFEIREKILDDNFLSASSIKKEDAMDWKRACEEFVKKCKLRGWN